MADRLVGRRGGLVAVATAPVSLNRCTLMRRDASPVVRLEAQRASRAERRRRSLRRGIARWHLDTVNTVRVTRVLLVALTFVDDDPMAARGAIRDFWHRFRDLAPDAPYFSWLELQRRGAPHYHAIIVNPPWQREGQARRWLTDHWPWSTIQPSVSSRSSGWFRARAGNYVKAYAKKPRSQPTVASVPPVSSSRAALRRPVVKGGAPSAQLQAHAQLVDPTDKSYQQDYDSVPRELRTFQCTRLVNRAADLDAHMDRPEIAWIYDPDPATGRIATGYLLATVHHTAARRGCSLPRRKRSRPRLIGTAPARRRGVTSTTTLVGR